MFVYLGQKILNLTEKGLCGVTYSLNLTLDLSVLFVYLSEIVLDVEPCAVLHIVACCLWHPVTFACGRAYM